MFPIKKILWSNKDHDWSGNGISSKSDHSPLLLHLDASKNRSFRRKFMFENSWLLEPDLEEIVYSGWSKPLTNDIIYKLNFCSSEMNKWGRNLRRKFHDQIDDCWKGLEAIRHLNDPPNVASFTKIQGSSIP